MAGLIQASQDQSAWRQPALYQSFRPQARSAGGRNQRTTRPRPGVVYQVAERDAPGR
jgi:hypothetical protein